MQDLATGDQLYVGEADAGWQPALDHTRQHLPARAQAPILLAPAEAAEDVPASGKIADREESHAISVPAVSVELSTFQRATTEIDLLAHPTGFAQLVIEHALGRAARSPHDLELEVRAAHHRDQHAYWLELAFAACILRRGSRRSFAACVHQR